MSRICYHIVSLSECKKMDKVLGCIDIGKCVQYISFTILDSLLQPECLYLDYSIVSDGLKGGLQQFVNELVN